MDMSPERIDPVSGNDIPIGATAENVRDDIPAQLSEGEYVVPADVVNYYGVKFFEDLRSEAKEGFQEMAETGRIGGEPIQPNMGDELPFDLSELEVVDSMPDNTIYAADGTYAQRGGYELPEVDMIVPKATVRPTTFQRRNFATSAVPVPEGTEPTAVPSSRRRGAPRFFTNPVTGHTVLVTGYNLPGGGFQPTDNTGRPIDPNSLAGYTQVPLDDPMYQHISIGGEDGVKVANPLLGVGQAAARGRFDVTDPEFVANPQRIYRGEYENDRLSLFDQVKDFADLSYAEKMAAFDKRFGIGTAEGQVPSRIGMFGGYFGAGETNRMVDVLENDVITLTRLAQENPGGKDPETKLTYANMAAQARLRLMKAQNTLYDQGLDANADGREDSAGEKAALNFFGLQAKDAGFDERVAQQEERQARNERIRGFMNLPAGEGPQGGNPTASATASGEAVTYGPSEAALAQQAAAAQDAAKRAEAALSRRVNATADPVKPSIETVASYTDKDGIMPVVPAGVSTPAAPQAVPTAQVTDSQLGLESELAGLGLVDGTTQVEQAVQQVADEAAGIPSQPTPTATYAGFDGVPVSNQQSFMSNLIGLANPATTLQTGLNIGRSMAAPAAPAAPELAPDYSDVGRINPMFPRDYGIPTQLGVRDMIRDYEPVPTVDATSPTAIRDRRISDSLYNRTLAEKDAIERAFGEANMTSYRAMPNFGMPPSSDYVRQQQRQQLNARANQIAAERAARLAPGYTPDFYSTSDPATNYVRRSTYNPASPDTPYSTAIPRISATTEEQARESRFGEAAQYMNEGGMVRGYQEGGMSFNPDGSIGGRTPAFTAYRPSAATSLQVNTGLRARVSRRVEAARAAAEARVNKPSGLKPAYDFSLERPAMETDFDYSTAVRGSNTPAGMAGSQVDEVAAAYERGFRDGKRAGIVEGTKSTSMDAATSGMARGTPLEATTAPRDYDPIPEPDVERQSRQYDGIMSMDAATADVPRTADPLTDARVKTQELRAERLNETKGDDEAELMRRRDIADKAISEDARRAGMTNTEFRVDSTKDKVASIREGIARDGVQMKDGGLLKKPEQIDLPI